MTKMIDGNSVEVALFAKSGSHEVLVSTEDYDIDNPSDSEFEYAIEVLGCEKTAIIFLESEV